MISFLLGVLSFMIAHFLLIFFNTLHMQFVLFILAGAVIEESLKISTAKLADVNLYLVGLGFAAAESVYYYSLFGSIVLLNRAISTASHLVFAWVFLRFQGRRGFAVAVATHFAYNAYWLL